MPYLAAGPNQARLVQPVPIHRLPFWAQRGKPTGGLQLQLLRHRARTTRGRRLWPSKSKVRKRQSQGHCGHGRFPGLCGHTARHHWGQRHQWGAQKGGRKLWMFDLSLSAYIPSSFVKIYLSVRQPLSLSLFDGHDVSICLLRAHKSVHFSRRHRVLSQDKREVRDFIIHCDFVSKAFMRNRNIVLDARFRPGFLRTWSSRRRWRVRPAMTPKPERSTKRSSCEWPTPPPGRFGSGHVTSFATERAWWTPCTSASWRAAVPLWCETWTRSGIP